MKKDLSLNLLSLPDIAIETVFSFLTYDEIARNRIVCKRFNQVGGRLLNRGFVQLEKRHATIYKEFKSNLPRRESERRSHPLSRQCNILQAVETRINMLGMTYRRYIKNNLLCFIPGKVLDEIKNVLDMVINVEAPPRTHQLLQELRDLSSMAMEHFEEHIFPIFKDRHIMYFEGDSLMINRQVNNQLRPPLPPQLPPLQPQLRPSSTGQQNLLFEIKKLKKQCNYFKRYSILLSNDMLKLLNKFRKQSRRIKMQSVKLIEQTTKIQKQDLTILAIKKHLYECEQKCKDLSDQMNKQQLLLAAPIAQPIQISTSASIQPVLLKEDIQELNLPINETKDKPNIINIDVQRKRKLNFITHMTHVPLKVTKKLLDNEENNVNVNVNNNKIIRNDNNVNANNIDIIVNDNVNAINNEVNANDNLSTNNNNNININRDYYNVEANNDNSVTFGVKRNQTKLQRLFNNYINQSLSDIGDIKRRKIVDNVDFN